MKSKEELPTYHLFVNHYDFFMLGNPLCNDPIPSKVSIDNSEYEIQLKFRGHHTMNLPKKSYFISFLNPQLYQGSKEIHLNAEYVDPSSIRNKLSLDLFQSFGVLSPASQHIQLYLNGTYEGVYLQLESVDELFLEKRGLPHGAIYYAINNEADFSITSPNTNVEKRLVLIGYERKIGRYKDDLFLQEFIQKINHTPQIEFPIEIVKYLDIEKYLRWLAVAVCTQNIDGFYHNYALYLNAEAGLFEMMPWDYDSTFGRDWDGKIVSHNILPIDGKNTLTKKLLEVPLFRNHYRKLLEELLDTLFTVENLKPIISKLIETIRPHHLFCSPEQLDNEIGFILSFITQRGQYLKNELRHY